MTRLRRHVALLIRLRQEAVKRLAPPPPPDASEGAYAGLFRGGTPPVSFSGIPLARRLELLERDRFPGGDTITQEAEEAKRGNWTLLGHPIRLDGDHLQWRTHPLSGSVTPLESWHRLRFLRGELGGDVKFLWELNRHKLLLRLAQHWFLSRDDSSARLLGRWLDGWMDQNPPGRGINWASSLEVSFRVIAWCWIAALTHDASIWNDQRRKRFLWFLWQHARHVERYDSVHHSPNTHLTGEALALLYVGCAFPQFHRAERWRRFGIAVLQEEMRHQLLDDGMHFERATGYHRYTVEILLHAMAQLRLSGHGPEGNSLEPDAVRATKVLAALRRPDGTVPVIGDEDGGNALPLSGSAPRNVAPLLALAGALLNHPEWIHGVPEPDRDLAWWLLDPETFVELPAGCPEPPPPDSFSLPAAGYFVARERAGKESWFCLVDGGPHGGNLTGHAHDDCSHVEIARGSLVISTDPGSAGYTGDEQRREWDRSASAHATLLLEGRSLATTRGPFGWKTVPPAPIAQAAEQGSHWVCRVIRSLDSGGGSPLHERQTVLLRGYGIIVCDWVSGGAGRPVRVTWPIPERLDDLRLLGESVRIAEQVCLSWQCVGLSVSTALLALHRFSPSYGESRDGSALVLRGVAQEQTVVLTSFTDAAVAVPRVIWSATRVVVEVPNAELHFLRDCLPEAVPVALRAHSLSRG